MRQKTFAPGAARAIFSTSASQSTANRRTPSSKARAMSRSFLIVLPIADAVGRRAGRQRQLDFGDRSRIEAGAELGEQRQHARIGIGLHRIEDARVRQRAWRRTYSCRARHRGRGRGTARLRGGCGETPGYDRSSRHPFEGRGPCRAETNKLRGERRCQRRRRAVETRRDVGRPANRDRPRAHETTPRGSHPV